MKFEFHIHTNASPEAPSTPAAIVKRAQALGLDGLAICDHNTITGAKELAKIAPFSVVIGEEVTTQDGEIIGLFLNQAIAKNLPLAATIKQIKEQGGLVCLPHPCDPLRRHVINLSALKPYYDQVDLIETFNARTLFSSANRAAAALAKKLGKPTIAGSDAHTLGEIGHAWCELPAFTNPHDFLTKITQAKFHTRRSPLFVHLITFYHKYFSR